MEQQLSSSEQPARYPRTRLRPNALRDWFDVRPKIMSKLRFAQLVGVSPSFVSQLTSDTPPWPSRDIAQRIAVVTEGAVTPNDLAGYPPVD